MRDLNVFGADFRPTLGDIAVADPVVVPQFIDAILRIEGMHLQSGKMNQEARADKFVVHLVIAQNMADVLTKKTFDAFSEFLHAIDVALLHPPCTISGIGLSRLERLDSFLHLEIP